MKYKSVALGIITALTIGLGFILISKSLRGSDREFESGVLNASKGENPRGSQKSFDDFSRLQDFLKEKPGIYGLYINDLKTKREFKLNTRDSFYGASLYKIIVGGAVFEMINKDELSLNYVYTYKSLDYATGTGLIKNYKIGSSYTVSELLDYLFKYSDNVAQNILERNLSWNDFNDFYSKYGGNAEFAKNLNTNPEEISTILYKVYNNPEWNRDLKRDFFMRMMNTQFEDRLAVGLSSDLLFAHKIGNAPQYTSWHDCGVVFTNDYTDPVFVCLMSKNTTYEDFLDASQAVGTFINSLYP